ncbi:MAG TPA: ribosome maturation factor RimM [Vicinamibacterales bacterium]|nr:ribosome maturation factor RimM [Vicinamibacterales bacterium]
MDWKAMALVGRIARAHGIRGQVIVNPETDFPDERFRPGAELFIERGGRIETLTVTTARFHRERPVIGIAGVETMNDAEALAGQELRVPIDRLAALPSGTFYRHDLIGCRVETQEGTAVGLVRDVEGTLTGSRLVVDGADGEVLIPLVSPICTLVDPAAKRIVIDPPAGLIDANAPRVEERP